MSLELDNFIIEYDEDISYIDVVISTLENSTNSILDFFGLKELSQKKKVVIFTDREEYKAHMLKYVKEFKEWMCADTYDGNINLLDINEARKSIEHRNMQLDDFIKCILHEFVHSCQQEFNLDSNGTSWYWEALATNLSGQGYGLVSLSDCDFEKLKEDFDETKNGYSYSYTLGNFMLHNYSREKILEYVKNSELLKKDADEIFALALQYQKEEGIKNYHK